MLAIWVAAFGIYYCTILRHKPEAARKLSLSAEKARQRRAQIRDPRLVTAEADLAAAHSGTLHAKQGAEAEARLASTGDPKAALNAALNARRHADFAAAAAVAAGKAAGISKSPELLGEIEAAAKDAEAAAGRAEAIAAQREADAAAQTPGRHAG